MIGDTKDNVERFLDVNIMVGFYQVIVNCTSVSSSHLAFTQPNRWCSRTLSDSSPCSMPDVRCSTGTCKRIYTETGSKTRYFILELWSAQTGWTEMNKQFCSFIGLFDSVGESSDDKLSDWVTFERKSDVCTFLLNSSWFSFILYWVDSLVN